MTWLERFIKTTPEYIYDMDGTAIRVEKVVRNPKAEDEFTVMVEWRGYVKAIPWNIIFYNEKEGIFYTSRWVFKNEIMKEKKISRYIDKKNNPKEVKAMSREEFEKFVKLAAQKLPDELKDF